MKKHIYLILLILCMPIVSADRAAETTLLTVVDDGDQRRGGTAHLHLEIEPGSGKVFMDSFPLTRVDTQISTRFAKELACDYTEYSCDNVDFFYTIRSNSPVVGGPSASALMTVLTVKVLQDEEMPQDITMTGTINSGGFIGPVSGIDEKTKIAEQEGFDTVLIPRYSQVTKDNTTIFGDEFEQEGIDVESVTTIDEALAFFGEEPVPKNSSITVPAEYQRIMGKVASQLCRRSDDLIKDVPGNISNDTQESYQDGVETLQSEDYYSAASYCFGSNVDLRQDLLADVDSAQKDLIRQSTRDEAEEFLEEVKSESIETMSDLEASIIVKERLYEVLNSYEDENVATGYLVERLNSARAWSTFFQYESPRINLNEQYLQDACLQKLSEAEERVSYIEFLIPTLPQFREELNLAREAYREKDYTYCLFKASKAKADANAVISSSQIPKEKETQYIEDKLQLARQQIAGQKAFFPILGYSYYNYASTLEDSPGLAMTFSEYASEFSALDMYFETDVKKPVPVTNKPVPQESFFVEGLILGICISLFITLLVVLVKKKRTQG